MSDEQTWELTLSEGPARIICDALGIAYEEGQLPGRDERALEAVMRAIAHQHPKIVLEFSYLPWPGNILELARELAKR